MVITIGGRSFGKTRKLLKQKENHISRLKKANDREREINTVNLCIIDELDSEVTNLRIKNENYLGNLIKYEKEIKELEERNKFITEENQEKVKQIEELNKKIEKLENRNKAKDMYMVNTSIHIKDLSNKYWDLKKEIKELEERNKFLIEENERNWKMISQIKDEDKEVIKYYLIKKRDLLDDQNAPVCLRQLIYNLIQELKNE